MASRKSAKVKAVNLDFLKNIQATLTDLKRVKVGIIGNQATEKHAGTFQTNAEIGLLQEIGSIRARIPARSFLKMPIMRNQREFKQFLLENKDKVLELILEGKEDELFAKIGIKAEAYIQEAFDTRGFGQWQENSPYTVSMKGSDSPLIDTAQLRRSISSEVHEKNR